MNSVKAVMNTHLKYHFTLFTMPWMVVIFSLLINVSIAAMVNKTEAFNTGGILSIIIFMLVAGIVNTAQTFPFSIDLSIRRKDYFTGTIMAFLIACILTSSLMTLFSFLESQVTGGWGYNVHFFSLLDYINPNKFWQLWCYFSILVSGMMFGFAISSLFQRAGKTGLYAFFTIIGLLLTVFALLFTQLNLWAPVFLYLGGHLEIVIWSMLVLAILFAASSYFLLRRAAV